MEIYAKDLVKKGIVVLPVESEIITTTLKKFQMFLENIPEFKNDPRTTPDRKVCLGGFGAPGFSSSFHAEWIRDLDDKVATTILKPLASIIGNGRNFELLIDRIKFRPSGSKPTGESWHRDLSSKHTSDVIFGSIVNFNQEGIICFSCVLGTQLQHCNPKDDGYTAIKNKKKIAHYKSQKTKIPIPPGHIAVFYESLIHEVLSTPNPFDSYRKSIGFAITDRIEMLYPDNERRMMEQEPLLYKGGEEPRMYSRTHLRNWPDKIETFCTKLNPGMLTTYTYKTGVKADRTINIPKQPAPSLTELNKRYRDWTSQEIDRYRPHPIV